MKLDTTSHSGLVLVSLQDIPMYVCHVGKNARSSHSADWTSTSMGVVVSFSRNFNKATLSRLLRSIIQ